MTTIETHVDESTNVEYKRFITDNGKHAIRVRDLDAGENIIVKHYPTETMCVSEYTKTLEAIKP